MVEQIYRSAFGADYPAGAQPSAFYSATTLQLAVDALRLRPGHVLADLGCGHGGAGLWAARQTGAALIGIDLSPAGIELARHRAAQLGLDRPARFLVGDMAATGLPDASCDAVMSLDVLPFVPDKAAAAGEIARILRPGGRLAFTTWERLGHPAGDDPQRRALAGTFHAHPLLESARADYRQLISQAGLTVETYQEPPGWRAQQQALAEGIIAAAAEVTADMGRHYPAMARVFLASLPDSRYVFVAAASRQIRPDRKENRRTGDTSRRPPAHCRRALPRLEVPQLKPACQGQGAGRHATGTPGYLGSAAGISRLTAGISEPGRVAARISGCDRAGRTAARWARLFLRGQKPGSALGRLSLGLIAGADFVVFGREFQRIMEGADPPVRGARWA